MVPAGKMGGFNYEGFHGGQKSCLQLGALWLEVTLCGRGSGSVVGYDDVWLVMMEFKRWMAMSAF